MDRGTQVPNQTILGFQIQGFHLLWPPIPERFPNFSCSYVRPYNPSCEVWAVPCSLTATNGISYDLFSSGYLDVSVPRLTFLRLASKIQFDFSNRSYLIRTPLDHSLLTAPQRISLPPASFFSFSNLGIHHLLY